MGVDKLINDTAAKVKEIRQRDNEKFEKELSDEFVYIKHEDTPEWSIRIDDGIYIISGKYPEYWGNRIPFDSKENFRRIYMKPKSKSVLMKLEDMKIAEGDIIVIENSTYTWRRY